MLRVLCTSLNAEQGPHFDILKAAGFDVRCIRRDVNVYINGNLIEQVKDADAIIAGSEPYPRTVIEALPKLRVIARTGVGFDAIDLKACDDRGIVVATTPGVNHHAVAEHTIAMLMAVSRGFPLIDRQVREAAWKRVARPRVMGRTIGIVGLGRIGQAVATRAAGLGMKILGFEPYPNREFCSKWNIDLVSFDELIKQSDYITLHCPMSPENKYLIREETIAKMKPGVVIINTARGLLINEKDLYAALKSGKVRAAGLDVFEVEPLPADSPLITLDNVILAGHLAGLDEESHRDTFAMCANIIKDLHEGKWPAECIQNLRGTTGWKW
ncbi:MAG: phosphoglycerate dehydrogenase [Planctomycetaceae bacterium]|nr:phosphoglycerate dehydrogenase [Planctomycetaceae bacterium]